MVGVIVLSMLEDQSELTRLSFRDDEENLTIEVAGKSEEYFGSDLQIRAILLMIDNFDTKAIIENGGYERLSVEMDKIKKALDMWEDY